ncbi:cytochrome b561 and DOMON domain-containing protein At4g17280-like [Lotus japonicus]|uniref:cytochrome b561 and DOMON domain-containing protein At4g17280-like n=1 Tax=Lotus japonicus TaxID=34305 RepID=UPI00258BB27B|nr:cytochrome b561 and DOMON domain-containing protein At4g17280-like [Lotus japonicus]XP_057452940.1 cytochrome b561 and DOMON domain-containing protein At4g17280-like [Lotus japonicus]
MVGSQALVAFRRTDGSFKAYTSPITSYATLLQEGNLSFPVHNVSGTYENGSIIIFASLQLPVNTTLVHGFLNAISWGILMPIGVIFARYLKTFNGLGATWFHLHRACQSIAFLIGIVGFVTGVYMGNHYGVHHGPHRCIGITLIVLATAQVFVAICLRPNKDHKYRKFWNFFHYIIGYSTIILAILNVCKGFDILHGHMMWKKMYIGVLISLAVIAVMLEVITWIRWCNKRSNSEESDDQQLP